MAPATDTTPRPWLRLRVLATMFANCSDWYTRGSMLRGAVLMYRADRARRHRYPPRP